MYKIIGADNKEYGPITLENIKLWLAEGRVTSKTLAQLDACNEWKPLGSFPEMGIPPIVPPQYLPQATEGQKSKLVAALLGIFLGGLGVHRFYLGYTTIGVLQIVVTICTFGFGLLWGFIEGICIIAGAGITVDANGLPLKNP